MHETQDADLSMEPRVYLETYIQLASEHLLKKGKLQLELPLTSLGRCQKRRHVLFPRLVKNVSEVAALSLADVGQTQCPTGARSATPFWISDSSQTPCASGLANGDTGLQPLARRTQARPGPICNNTCPFQASHHDSDNQHLAPSPTKVACPRWLDRRWCRPRHRPRWLSADASPLLES